MLSQAQYYNNLVKTGGSYAYGDYDRYVEQEKRKDHDNDSDQKKKADSGNCQPSKTCH